MDRHSYEIQIKELAVQVSEGGTFKVENTKLKEFIKRQVEEIEGLKLKSDNTEATDAVRRYE